VNPLKIKIPSKNMREKPTNATIICSVYYVCYISHVVCRIGTVENGCRMLRVIKSHYRKYKKIAPAL
jgi:hypothetical protein